MTTMEGPTHLLSLKVMRISRPDLASAWHPFYSSSPSFSAHSTASVLSLQGNAPLSGHPKTLRDLTSTSEVLILPSSFGSIQLGETFSSCLCVNNETQVNIEVTQVRVEIQTTTSKVMLYEMDGLGRTVAGGDALELVVNHEIKELGQHVLACMVTYRLPLNARAVVGASEDANDPSLQTFRKFYKFAVTNPFSVKTKVHSAKSPSALLSVMEREKIFLEVHIQNLTQDAIYFERMRLECTDDWDMVDGNMVPDLDDNSQTSIFSKNMALMQPQDMRQYVYILTPKVPELTPANYVPGSIIPLGRLDISWRSHFGEPGRLLTSMLSRRIPLPPAQPASAVPPHLKKSIAGVAPPRPYSSPVRPQPQSRPGTPGLGHRPSSPIVGRTSISSEVAHVPLPELEAQLIVRHVPRDDIITEKPFAIAFSVVLSSSVPPGRERLKRRVTLAIQHLKRKQRAPSPVVPPQESSTPRLPSSGFSTPASTSAGTFNYALAHQKILAASSRPSLVETAVSDGPIQGENANTLPPPFFEGNADVASHSRNVLSFVGPSAIGLPPLEIDYSRHTTKPDQPPKLEYVQDFELTFAGLRNGISVVEGLRILLTEDEIVQDEEIDDETVKNHKVEILKEYDTVAEVWVSS